MGREDDRLHLLYEVTRRLASFTDLDELLRYATGRARELLDAEGAAVMLLDPARREFNFGVASQSATHQATSARLLEIRRGCCKNHPTRVAHRRFRPGHQPPD